MTTLPVVLRAVPLAVVLAIAARLIRSAASHWSRQRAGRAYELPADYRPVLLRASAATFVLLLGVAVAVLPLRPLGVAGGPATSAVAKSDGAPPAALPGHAGHRRRPARRTARPSPSRSAPAAGKDGQPRSLAAAAGGTLEVLADGTRVWLPPQYALPAAAGLGFPVIVAYLPDADPMAADLYPAIVRQVAQGRADPFVVVQPSGCAADPLAALASAARHFRLLPGATARGLLGAGPLAPCAVRAALARPDTFGAYAAVSGDYGRGLVPESAAPATSPHLLLATADGEPARRRSAYRLRTALRSIGVEPRVIDTLRADPRLGGGRQRRELAVAVQYFTEELDGPRNLPPLRRG